MSVNINFSDLNFCQNCNYHLHSSIRRVVCFREHAPGSFVRYFQTFPDVSEQPQKLLCSSVVRSSWQREHIS
jgi:hypothetical protein